MLVVNIFDFVQVTAVIIITILTFEYKMSTRLVVGLGWISRLVPDWKFSTHCDL